MSWDPVVLRKYNTTGHFRLINQVRTELKDNPLVRPKEGQSVGEANLSRSLTRALEGRGGSQRNRRSGSSSQVTPPTAESRGAGAMPTPANDLTTAEQADPSSAASFRDRLNAIDLR